MKKLTLSLSAVSLALALSACGSSGGSSEPTKTTTGTPLTTPAKTSGSVQDWDWIIEGTPGNRSAYVSTFNAPDPSQGLIGIESALAVACIEGYGARLSVAVTDRTWDGYLYVTSFDSFAASPDAIVAAPTSLEDGFELSVLNEADSEYLINRLIVGDSTIVVQFTGSTSTVGYSYDASGFAGAYAAGCDSILD